MTISPERLEVLVLSALVTPNDVTYALQKGVTPESFQVPEHQLAFHRMSDAVAGGTRLPSHADLKELGIEVADEVKDFELYVDELSRASKAGAAFTVLKNEVPKIQGDPDASMRRIIGSLSDLITSGDVHTSKTDQHAVDRLTKLRELKEKLTTGQHIGIPTGLGVFDDNNLDWRPGELSSIIGYTSVGKSFLLTYMCCQAYLEGKRVLMISPENPTIDMEWRADVFLSKLDDDEWNLSLHELRVGTADLDVYEKWTEKFGLRDDWITIDSGEHGPFTVSDVVALSREHRPDFLAIDGFNLISGEGQMWERIQESGLVIKGLTQNLGMVTVAAAQARREVGVFPDDPPELHQVAYGHSIVEASNRVISLGQVRGDDKTRCFTVPKFRDGEKSLARRFLRFDVDSGDIREMSS